MQANPDSHAPHLKMHDEVESCIFYPPCVPVDSPCDEPDEATVVVPVRMLDALRDGMNEYAWFTSDAPHSINRACRELVALIYEPEWEPTEEQVRAYEDARGYKHEVMVEGGAAARRVLVDDLKAAAKVFGVQP